MSRRAILAAMGLTAFTAGCSGPVGGDPAATASVPPASIGVVASWRTPPQLDRILEAARVRGESNAIVWVPGTGYVTGSPDVLATIGSALPDKPGRNTIVEPCRATVLAEAAKLGAVQVEAASDGPEQRDPEGRIFAPVDMRITYRVPGGYELRRATLTCILDRTGRVVDAYT